MVSLFGAGSFIAQLIGGELTDRLGCRPVMLMSFFITPVFMITLGLAKNIILILPLDMQANGLGPQQYDLAIAINGLLIILVTIPVSNMAANWPRFETIAVATILLGLGFGFTALTSTLPFYMISVAIWTIGEIAGTAVGPAIIADLSPPELRGLYQGVYGSAWGLAFFFGPLAGGWVFEHWGSNSLWSGCLILGIAVSIGFLMLSRRVNQENSQVQ